METMSKEQELWEAVQSKWVFSPFLQHPNPRLLFQ